MARNFIPLVPSGTINADASVAQLEQDVLAMDSKVGELAEDIGDTEQEINELKSQITEIPQDYLAFATEVKSENLFDYTDDEMCIPTYWYYSTSVGSTVTATTNQYTQGYAAIKIPVDETIEKLTIGQYPAATLYPVNVFWVGAVDSDMKLIAYTTTNTPPPVTYTIPTGTAFVLITYSVGSDMFDKTLPATMVVSGESITKYEPYFKPYYSLEDCSIPMAEETKRITDSIIGSEENTVKLKLPDVYDAVVGDTIQIFYKGIINAVNYEDYYVEVSSNYGKVYTRYFEFTPTATGNVSADFILYGMNHNVIDRKTVTFAVRAVPSSPATQKNVLCVGDSLTYGGVWPKELYRRLTGSGGTPAGSGLTNINFIGNNMTDGVHFEGHGGWKLSNYNAAFVSSEAKNITCTHDKTDDDLGSLYSGNNGSIWKIAEISAGVIKIVIVAGASSSLAASGTLHWYSGGVNKSDIVYSASEDTQSNPFWDDSANKIDFAAYAETQGVSSIDYVLLLIGWNAANDSMTQNETEMQTFVDNVHTSFPNAKIILMGLQIPSRDGLAYNYANAVTGGSIYSKFYEMMQYVFANSEMLARIADDNSNVKSLNLAGQFDTEYNMPTGTRKANTRSEIDVTFQNNGVHPAQAGSYQIADAFYRNFISVI